MFIAMLFKQDNTKAQSLTIAISKWIGTLTPTIYGAIYAVDLGLNYYVLLTGILCSVFDLIYIYFLYKFNKNGKVILER